MLGWAVIFLLILQFSWVCCHVSCVFAVLMDADLYLSRRIHPRNASVSVDCSVDLVGARSAYRKSRKRFIMKLYLFLIVLTKFASRSLGLLLATSHAQRQPILVRALRTKGGVISFLRWAV